jgi:hypothetical protein
MSRYFERRTWAKASKSPQEACGSVPAGAMCPEIVRSALPRTLFGPGAMSELRPPCVTRWGNRPAQLGARCKIKSYERYGMKEEGGSDRSRRSVSSRPTRFTQNRNATTTNVGVHANIIPNAIAWMVVTSAPAARFRSFRFLSTYRLFPDHSTSRPCKTTLSPLLGLIVAEGIVAHCSHTYQQVLR